ncbi:MAG: hypothetical protein ACLUNQ_07000 [Oscillospiraceae bacterium]
MRRRRTGPSAGAEGRCPRRGRVRAVNRLHPRWQELLSPLPRKKKVRVNLLGLGDVGATLLMGLRLLGGDVISSIGICDLRENVPQRWEFELNQINLPGPYDTLPPVEIIGPEELFRGDVFLFCASRFVPDTAVKDGDVRMAQYQLNRELVALYAKRHGRPGTRGFSVWSAIRWTPCAGRPCWRATGMKRGTWTAWGCFPTRSGASAWGS